MSLRSKLRVPVLVAVVVCFARTDFVLAQPGERPAESDPIATRRSPTYLRIRRELDQVPAIDTHDHLFPFDGLRAYRETKEGRGVNLAGLWQNSYLNPYALFPPWKDRMEFDDWWGAAKNSFRNVRAMDMYRYQWLAFRDLYGVDFDTITDEQARALDRKVFENYKDQRWLYHIVTERANIELMLNDPHWNCHGFVESYPFEIKVLNVTKLPWGFHTSEYEGGSPWGNDNPYEFAKKHGLPMESLDDYLKVLDRLFLAAKDNGVVCLKSAIAYLRGLDFDNVSKEKAAAAFGKRRSQLSPEQAKAFEDFIIWQICERSARYELPFQIHTGLAKVPGSNPMNLVNLIEGNARTKFILFHGGYPWISETAVIVQKYWWHVWLDSVWTPMVSYTAAKQGYHEWLEAIPSNRLMWGADCNHGEGVYGATALTRQCIAEALAEKVLAGDLREPDALQIGRGILRENALELFPQLKERLWKQTGKKLTPPVAKEK